MLRMVIEFNDDGTHDVVIVAPGDGTITPDLVSKVQPILDRLIVRNLRHYPEVIGVTASSGPWPMPPVDAKYPRDENAPPIEYWKATEPPTPAG